MIGFEALKSAQTNKAKVEGKHPHVKEPATMVGGVTTVVLHAPRVALSTDADHPLDGSGCEKNDFET